MQGSWLSKKAREIQSYTDRHNSRRYFDALKVLYCPQSCGVLTSPECRWHHSHHLEHQDPRQMAEHFESVLNKLSIINDEVTDCIEQVDINQEMDIHPQVSKVKKAIDQLLSGIAPGADTIPAEVYKVGSTSTINKLSEVFQTFWFVNSRKNARNRTGHRTSLNCGQA